MKHLLLSFSFLLTLQATAQTTFCPNDPPKNPFLADSPWPTYHRNNYAQASTCIPGPLPGDSLRIYAKTEIEGGTSPWVYLTEKYATGERALLYSNSTHVFKLIDNGNEIVTADSQRIDFDPVSSFGWNFLLAKNKVWFTYDPKYDPVRNRYTRLFKLTDADTTDPYSDIVVLDTFSFETLGINRVQSYNLSYEGNIVFGSEADEDSGFATVGILTQDFQVLDTLRYATSPGEIVHHNTFPVDENNSFYIVTTTRMIKFGWDGTDLSKEWEAAYDFINDGPRGSFAEGSGTTPTLMGWGAGNDQLIVVADGHRRNNLVAFWRELPLGWTPRPGMDPHFADSIKIPLAIAANNIFQSIENSPTVRGYELAIAQFNGFLGYDCNNSKGVQKLVWDTTANEFEVAWTQAFINMNGVLTYSEGAGILYGSGKEADCNYYYYGLDWETGDIELRLLLGPEGTFLDDPFYDAGNNNILDEEGNIYFPGGASLVKVEIVQRSTSLIEPSEKERTTIFPNPVRSHFYLPQKVQGIRSLSATDPSGRKFLLEFGPNNRVEAHQLPTGVYFLHVETDHGWDHVSFMKE
ncbi:MAG: T9SS type A sorting domain-containing protein [Bacteroidota bacterium]